FDTLFRRLFVYEATVNPHPWRDLPGLQAPAVALTKTVLTALAITTLVRLIRIDRANSAAPSLGVLGILVLLVAPATATYHFVLLWLPVALLVGDFLRESAPPSPPGGGWPSPRSRFSPPTPPGPGGGAAVPGRSPPLPACFCCWPCFHSASFSCGTAHTQRGPPFQLLHERWRAASGWIRA